MSRLENAPTVISGDFPQIREGENFRSPSIHFTRELPGVNGSPGRAINTIRELLPLYPDLLARHIEKVFGPLTLHEAEPDSPFAPETLAIKCVEETGQKPDIIIVCGSHLDPIDKNNPLQQNAALRTRNTLAQMGMADGLDEATPVNTHTFSAACSSFVLALDFLRQTNPIGKNVLVVIDETQYRRTMPPPENDPGKVGLLFSDSRIAMQFKYGEDFTVLASEFHYLPQYQQLLTMHVPEFDPEDSFLTAFSPNPGEYFSMEGQTLAQIFGELITRDALLALAGSAGLTEEEIAFLEVHQASLAMAKTLNKLLPDAVSSEGIREYGNTSSASVPLDLEDEITEGRIQDGDAGIVVAYGGGIAWGAAVVQFGKPLEEQDKGEALAAA